MTVPVDGAEISNGFSERDFYLAEFRGRTLAFALPAATTEELALLEAVLTELEANGSRAIILSTDRTLLEKIGANGVLDVDDPGWIGKLWRWIRNDPRVGVEVPAGASLAAECRRLVLQLRLAKLIWLDAGGSLEDDQGERVSLVDVAGLEKLLRSDALSGDRRALLEEIGVMLAAGLPAVNLCSLAGLSDELFSFQGSGTFFARERYMEVRKLSLDEFDAADELIQRGVIEGYLVERTPDQLEEILANAFGVFVEGRYLAGIGAMLPRPASACGEISSLYTLTRFVGEGVGGHLVRYALESAAESGFAYVFACTTSDRVKAFFERHRFEEVKPEQLPAEKWRDYPEERRARLDCMRRDV
ncbi:MAG: GNAT family N-acetyltransferase [Myxococcota bacterium]|nr:GNAT family N-acetyltransferase [Myxococcota bacterium]